MRAVYAGSPALDEPCEAVAEWRGADRETLPSAIARPRVRLTATVALPRSHGPCRFDPHLPAPARYPPRTQSSTRPRITSRFILDDVWRRIQDWGRLQRRRFRRAFRKGASFITGALTSTRTAGRDHTRSHGARRLARQACPGGHDENPVLAGSPACGLLGTAGGAARCSRYPARSPASPLWRSRHLRAFISAPGIPGISRALGGTPSAVVSVRNG